MALHPRDRADMRKARSTESGEYFSGGPFQPTRDTLWDLPAVKATGAALHVPLVGDYANGATLFLREAVNIRISDSDQDDFTRNLVTVLAEARVALAVWYPGLFAEVNLALAVWYPGLFAEVNLA